MINFTFHTPTKIYFGKDTHFEVGKIISEYGFKKVLLHYGQSSIKKSGLYDVIVKCLKAQQIDFIELGGVEPNPKIGLVRKGVELCKAEQVDFILAVGGGSVIDSAKAIGVGAKSSCDPWDFFAKKQEAKDTLPVGTVLTIAAAGSEMSDSCVITNPQGQLKRGFGSQLMRPLFSILNPELTYSVSKYQTGCGIVDIMMHTIERYFCFNEEVELVDNIAHGLLKAVISAGKIAIENPNDYEARATLMWASSLSHNDLTGAGRDYKTFTCHQLEHELSGMYDEVAHGAGLSVIFPAWGKYIYKHNIDRFCKFAVNVWNVDMDFAHKERTAKEGILRSEAYFSSIGMPTRLSELGVTGGIEQMAIKCTHDGNRKVPSYIDLDKAEIMEIFNYGA